MGIMNDLTSYENQFAEYDKNNPAIWKLFVDYARALIKAQKKRGKTRSDIKLSSKMIINRIRWEQYVDVDSDLAYKIPDQFTAYYARKFADVYPDWAHCFEFRKLRAK